MNDEVSLHINDKVFKGWKSYDISSDIYSAGSTFNLEFANSIETSDIPEGALYKLKVNGQLALTGVGDVIEDEYSKDSDSLKITGRDLMGQVIDEYCNDFSDHTGASLKAMAEKFLNGIAYITRKSVLFDNGADKLTTEKAFAKAEPGATVFEFLRSIAQSRGFLFHCTSDGMFVFEKPKKVLMPGMPLFTLIRSKDGFGNNVIKASRKRDFAKRYRTIRIIGQKQGTEDFADPVNIDYSITDKKHPFNQRVFVAQFNQDEGSANHQAMLIQAKQNKESFSLVYTTYGHDQHGRLWDTNQFCHVEDHKFGINENFLIVNRSFSKSKEEGTTTTVTLAKPELVI
jgi:prophage tail gpP-like protein